MNTPKLFRCLLTALTVSSLTQVLAQDGLPATQPNRLTIYREQVKPGHEGAHARHEAGWVAAFEKAKSPNYYLALASMTGAPEAWFIVPFDSHAAEAESMKRFAKDPVLSAEADRLALADAEHISGINTIQLMARPDLGLGKFPTLAKTRYFEVLFFSVRQGKETLMDTIMKTYASVRKRVAPDSAYRVYMVAAGMPEPTYVVFQSVTDYAEFDRTGAEHAKVFETATAEEMATLNKWGDAVMKSENNRYRLDPGMSYVSKEVRASDPEFWMTK